MPQGKTQVLEHLDSDPKLFQIWRDKEHNVIQVLYISPGMAGHMGNVAPPLDLSGFLSGFLDPNLENE
jgi:hypothetical protein